MKVYSTVPRKYVVFRNVNMNEVQPIRDKEIIAKFKNKLLKKSYRDYMLFVTGPYLISNFVGNINNFNVIYLLSGGNPMFTNINGAAITNPTALYGAGQTDLLITWLYKMCMGQVTKDYGVASVIGIFVFVVVATFSLILYGRTNAVKNEGDFQ